MQNNTKLIKRRDEENTKDKGKFNIIVDLEKERERERESYDESCVLVGGERNLNLRRMNNMGFVMQLTPNFV